LATTGYSLSSSGTLLNGGTYDSFSIFCYQGNLTLDHLRASSAIIRQNLSQALSGQKIVLTINSLKALLLTCLMPIL